MIHKVEKKDLTGKLSGLPLEVVQLMVKEQVRQGNPADVKVFQKKIEANKDEGGFDLDKSMQGAYVWRAARIGDYRLALPWCDTQSETEPKFPCLMWVGETSKDVEERIRKRVVFMKKNGKFIAWNNAESLEKAEGITGTTSWAYAIPVTEVVVTMQEIAEKFGCDIRDLKIVE